MFAGKQLKSEQELKASLDKSFDVGIRYLKLSYANMLIGQLWGIDENVLEASDNIAIKDLGKFLRLMKEVREECRDPTLQKMTYGDLFRMDEYHDLILRFDFSDGFRDKVYRSMRMLIEDAIGESIDDQVKIRNVNQQFANKPIIGYFAMRFFGYDPQKTDSKELDAIFKCTDPVKARINKELREEASQYMLVKDNVYTKSEREKLKIDISRN